MTCKMENTGPMTLVSFLYENFIHTIEQKPHDDTILKTHINKTKSTTAEIIWTNSTAASVKKELK